MKENEMNKGLIWTLLLVAVAVMGLSACQPETVEVTRVITETVVEEVTVVEEIEVTREVEGEIVTEMVEVTRVVEVEVEVEVPVEAEEEMVESPQTAQTLRVAITDDESTSNPYTYVTGYPGWNILTLQYDTLYQFDADGVPQQWLVTNTEISDDGMTVTLDLRDDVFWNDGEQLTAEDVKFTFDYFKVYTHGRFSRDLNPVESTETEGDYRVTLTLAAPSPNLAQAMLADVPIMPQHIWADIDNPDDHVFDNVTNVSSGPYKIVEYEPDQFYRLEANPDYFAGPPNIDELVLVRFADDTGTLAGFLAGEVDMIIRPAQPEQIGLLKAIDGVGVSEGPLFTTQLLIYDVEKPPFNNLAVRQAMSLAIDRQDMVNTIYLGAATAGSAGWIHPVSPFFNDAVVTAYDPEAAMALLDEAGIVDSDEDGIRELDGEPVTFEFIVDGGNSIRLRIAELTREMLAAVGINAEVTALERTTLVQAVWPDFDVSQGRNYDMAVFGWSAPVQADPIRFPNLVHSDTSVGTINLTGYSSETMDALGDELAQTVDPVRQGEILDQMQLLMAEELPFIMLMSPDGAYTYRADVYDNWVFMTGRGVFHKVSLLDESVRP
jgi:peptide/nickel transport system substrate-binding protein